MADFKTTVCYKCLGEGFTMEHPGVDYHMKEKEEKQCDACHGFGEYLFLPPKLRVIVDREVKTDLTVWKK